VADIRTVELAGTPRAMGESFGERFRDDIRRFTESRIGHLAASVRQHDRERSLSREAILAIAGRTVDAHRSFCPPIWEEFAAIARAAGLTIEELLIGNGLTDFRDFALLAATPEHTGECTAFLVPAAVTDGGHPIVGQTWDMNADARDFLAFVHRKPDDAPETLGLTTTGCLCLIGMNSEGVAVGNTNLVPTDVRVGVNYLFTITHALRCTSAQEAADAIEATPRLSGHNYYAADATLAINLEATAQQACRTVVDREVFVHANHYLAESLQSLAFRSGSANSQWRQERLTANFQRVQAPLAMADCWNQLTTATQADVPADRQAAGAATVAAVVQCPATRTLYVCEGPPREGEYEVLTL
jgi:predicted choloylglycine hydrolase